MPLSKIPVELLLENLTPRNQSRPVDNFGHMLDVAWASKREALTNHSVDGRGRVLLGCHRLVVPHNREHVREAFEIAHKELLPVRSSSVFLALVQECVEEDVDLHSHEILTPRHSVEDPSQEDKPPSKVTHAVLGLTLLICDRPSRLCGHALDIVLHALPHSGKELVQVGFWYALNLAFKFFQRHEAEAEVLQSRRVLVMAGPASGDLGVHRSVHLGPHLLASQSKHQVFARQLSDNQCVPELPVVPILPVLKNLVKDTQ